MGGNDLLNGLKVVENSLLGPGLVGTFLSDLGAEVIKIQSPSGNSGVSMGGRGMPGTLPVVTSKNSILWDSMLSTGARKV